MATPALQLKHSGGPRTAAGIERCKYNATKHGLTGNQVILQGEDAAAYDELRASLLEEYKPACEEEAMLVDRIAQNWWKLLRAERWEINILHFMAEQDEDIFLSPRYLNFIRYRNQIERAWNRARAELAALKKASAKAQPEPAKSADAPKPQPAAYVESVSQQPVEAPVQIHKPETGVSFPCR